jgi:hypothetical protein
LFPFIAGNIQFREIVQKHKLRYLVASKVEKPKVAREVVQLWREQDPPGRFLARKDDSRKGPGSVKAEGTIWFDVGDKKAREKASQCLREQAKEKEVQCLRELATDVIPFVTFVSEMQRQQEVLTTHDLVRRTTNEETRDSGQKLAFSNLETLYPGFDIACRPNDQETRISGQKRTFSNLETFYPNFDLACRVPNEEARVSRQKLAFSNLETLYPNFGDVTGNLPFPMHYYSVYR